MKAFTNTICLRTPGFCLGVVNIFNIQVKLVLVMLPGSAVFCGSVSKDSEQVNVLFSIEGQYFIIKHIGCYQGVLAVIYFHKRYAGVGVYISQLIGTFFSTVCT